METATNPVYRPTQRTKILLSPGHGAGYVSWAPRRASDAFLVWMLTYEPLISGLEQRLGHDKLEDIMTHFHLQAKAKFNIDRIVTARVGDLLVEEVSAPFEIREVEGMERLFDVSRRREIVLGAPEKVEEVGVGVGTVPAPSVGQLSREIGAKSPPAGQQNRDDGARSVPLAVPVQVPVTASQGVPPKSTVGKSGK
ncbi:hypothetical protein LTR86_008826 [Recurvomyces mirabilis]|nr:hypothetical protein LTR86_008826 [Recurvomyces mirabilis]